MVSDPQAKTIRPHDRGRRRAPGARRPAPGAALGARARPVRRHLVAARAASSPPTRRSSSRSAATSRRRSTCASSSHLEQLETRSDPDRNPLRWELATAYLGLVPRDVDPALPADTRWHPVDALPAARVRPRADRARRRASGCARSSRTRTSASRSRRRRSRSPSSATSTAPRSATTSRRRTSSACCSAATCSCRPASTGATGPAGGRPAALYGFRARELEITDQFAVLRPPH